MPLEISYSEARNNLASLLDRVTDDREVVVINRRGHERVAVISADELNSVLESLYLLPLTKEWAAFNERHQQGRSRNHQTLFDRRTKERIRDRKR